MNENISQTTTQFVWRRVMEPFFIKGVSPQVWWVVVGIIVFLGILYTAWNYFRDSKSIGWKWAVFLGLMRSCVLVILGVVFMLPARQTWHETRQTSKVVLVFDVSGSMTTTRDDMPTDDRPYATLPTRQDKVFNFVVANKFDFIKSLLKTNPITAYRFGKQLDKDSLTILDNKFWGREEWEQVLAAQGKKATPPAGYGLNETYLRTWLHPDPRDDQNKPLPLSVPEKLVGEGSMETTRRELARMVKETEKLRTEAVFSGTAVADSVFDVVKRERNNMVQGVVVFTDGRSTDSNPQALEDLTAACKTAGIPLFMVVVGEDRPKISIDVTDLRVPPLIRPDDRFRAAVSVNGTDMVNEPFAVFLDVTRINRIKEKDPKTGKDIEREIEEDIQIAPINEEGQVIAKEAINLGRTVSLYAGLAKPQMRGKQIKKEEEEEALRGFARERPVFKQGTPPSCQVEFELDALVLAQALVDNVIQKNLAEEQIRKDRVALQNLPPDKAQQEAARIFERHRIDNPWLERLVHLKFTTNQGELEKAVSQAKDAAAKKEAEDKLKEFKDLVALEARLNSLVPRLRDLLDKRVKIGIVPHNEIEMRFKARIPRDKREITDIKEHFSDPADMRVQDKPLRVLLFASAATREYQFVRTLLVREMDKGRAEVCIHLQTVGEQRRTGIVQDIDPKRILDRFPNRLLPDETDPFDSLASYDVVVAFDADWFQLKPETINNLYEWVNNKGGGLIVIGGDLHTREIARPEGLEGQARIKPILNMLPVVLEDARKEEVETDEPRRLNFPQGSGELEYLRLEESDPKDRWQYAWKRFFDEEDVDDKGTPRFVNEGGRPERGVYSYFPSKELKQSGKVVASIADPAAKMPNGLPQPWMVLNPIVGKGKCVWLASGESWRLRMYKEAYHERFWTKLLRDVGSASVNTFNRRITPNMSRAGVVNRYQTFEAKFEGLDGKPLPRDVKTPPKLLITLPEGVTPQKGDTVLLKQGEFTGKQGKVLEVFYKNVKGGDVQHVRLDISQIVEVRVPKDRPVTVNSRLIVPEGPYAGRDGTVLRVIPDPDPKSTSQTVTLDLAGVGPNKIIEVPADKDNVEVMIEPLAFKPRLGSQNDGWFQVDFQPRVVGEYKMKIQLDEKNPPYPHRYLVREANAEKENVRPDMDTLLALASSAKPVLDRLGSDEKLKNDLRTQLKRLQKVKSGATKPDEGGVDDESLKLLFDLESARMIPQCMKAVRNDVRNRGKLEDLWDDGVEIMKDSSGERPIKVAYVLIAVVGLLSIEWLMRKLLRLA